MRFGTVVAFGPPTDLPFQITFGLTQIGEAYRSIVHTVQANEIINKGFAEPPRLFRGKIQVRRHMPPKNDAVNRIHHVERCADDGIVVAIKEHFGGRGINRVELGKHTKFAAHVVSGLDLASERWPSKDELPGPEA